MITYMPSSSVPSERLWRVQAAPSGHLSPITTIDAAPGPEGTVVTGGYDGQVFCWDHAMTSPRWVLRFEDLVNSVEIDPTVTRVAIAVADGFGYVADLATGLIQHQLGPHGDDVNDVSWHPTEQGTLALVCDAWDVRVHLWDLTHTARGSTPLLGHEHGIFAVEFAPFGDLLATASEDGTVRIWSSRGSRLVAVLAHPGDVETLAWSPDGTRVATGCDDKRLRLWASEEWTQDAELAEADGSVRKVGYSPTGGSLLSASYDGMVRVYDAESLSLRATFRGPLQWERACLLTDDDHVVIGSFGAQPSRWSLHGDEPMHRPAASRRTWRAEQADLRTWGVNAIALSPEGLIYAGTDCGLVVRLEPHTVIHEGTTLVTTLELSDGDVAIGDYLGRLFVVAGEAKPYLVAETAGGPLNAIAWLPDGTLMTGSYDGWLRRWSRDGEQLDAVRAHRGPVKSLTWCPAAHVVVAGSSDDTVSAWHLDGGMDEVGRCEKDGLVLVNGVAASALWPWVAMVSRDRHVRLWYPLESRPVTVLPLVHQKSAKAVAVSPDGRLIVSGSYDGTVCCWHLDGSQNLRGWRRLLLHGKPGVSSVAVNDDRFVTAGWDGTVAEWSHGGDLFRHYLPVVDDGDTRSAS